jgi:hypothetical protein
MAIAGITDVQQFNRDTVAEKPVRVEFTAHTHVHGRREFFKGERTEVTRSQGIDLIASGKVRVLGKGESLDYTLDKHTLKVAHQEAIDGQAKK